MKKLSAAASLFLLSCFSAIAADLPSMKSASISIPNLHNWSGLYSGVNIGYGFTAYNAEYGYTVAPQVNVVSWGSPAMSQTSVGGVFGGGQLGYNYQWNPYLVLGFEADIQASDINGTGYGASKAKSRNAYTSCTETISYDWFGTARGRIGLTMPNYSNILIQGTGGFAYGYVNDTNSKEYLVFNPLGSGASGASTFANTKAGWTAGGGIEWSPQTFPTWSAKVEYLYTSLGSALSTFQSNYTSGGQQYSAFSGHWTPFQFNSIRVGINWHFNPFVGEPVVAKY